MQLLLLNELIAEDNEVAKAIEFHDEVEAFAVKVMQALKDAQTSKAAAILDWKGCELDLTRSGIDSLSNLTDREYLCADARVIILHTFGVYQDPPSTLSWGYMVPNNGYLGPNRG